MSRMAWAVLALARATVTSLNWCDLVTVDDGREAVTLGADEARSRYKKIRARFAAAAPTVEFPLAKHIRREGRELELTVNGHSEEILRRLQALAPEELTTETLTLEEIFVAALK